MLVVAFGSAPGVPNWAGLLSRMRKSAQDPAHECFDVLYVVDPARSWYNGKVLPAQPYATMMGLHTDTYTYLPC